MRHKLFVPMIAAGLLAVPAAFAATAGEGEPSPRLAKFAAFQKDEVRAFRRAERREAKRRAARRERAWRSIEIPAALEAIAACESHGNPRAVSSTGTYRGKYQFSYATWAAVGGSGDPAAASEAEQDYRAALLYNQSGPGQWPVCGS